MKLCTVREEERRRGEEAHWRTNICIWVYTQLYFEQFKLVGFENDVKIAFVIMAFWKQKQYIWVYITLMNCIQTPPVQLAQWSNSCIVWYIDCSKHVLSLWTQARGWGGYCTLSNRVLTADTEQWLADAQNVAVHREREDGHLVVKAQWWFGSQQLLASHFPPLASYHPSHDRKCQSEPQAFLSLLGESRLVSQFSLNCIPWVYQLIRTVKHSYDYIPNTLLH